MLSLRLTGVLVLASRLHPASCSTLLSESNTIVLPRSTNEDLRTPAQIFLNCFFTLLLCIWFCGRPNIPVKPPPHKTWYESWLPALGARIRITIWLLLSPQLILVWAVRQWRGATSLKHTYANQGPGWTRVHGFMMNMGGFVLYKDGRPIQALSRKRFASLLRVAAIEFPWVTEEEITDRGKSSWALVLLFAVQTGWFVVQCIARLVKHGRFAVTLLELETWAIVVVSWVIAGVFWEKPLDARVPIRVDLKIEMEISKDETPDVAPFFPSTWRDSNREETIQKKVLSRIAEEYGLDPEPPRRKLHLSTFQTIAATLIFPFVWPIARIYMDHLAITCYPKSINLRALTAPTFYHTDEKTFADLGWQRGSEMLLGFVGALIGGAHFVLWGSTFPNHSWDLLWRFSIFSTTAVPGLFFILHLLDALADRLPPFSLIRRFSQDFFAFALAILGVLGHLVYAAARVIILVQALVSLTFLTIPNIQTVEWTGYIPHLG
ncbi:unnamed protein product [Cyclocybe aegerita]|uniref:Uncharacterized protein n=1 Tax=Cyclocybe aegerita TaxID=1973307 RepID=A0A8S0W158_CYCAE|nr:unnamed protein product [Cyclocybe aegerita]